MDKPMAPGNRVKCFVHFKWMVTLFPIDTPPIIDDFMEYNRLPGMTYKDGG